ncbi:invasion associated locus B family protein [Paralimibaculum aggregatum]|uniref:Invasion associated locus B family protein n=1 Tax=Paralimibaculum aggregatum TaxID=3036245 RepID=A0ABQ6LT21_9RHOB|nr:invasion associated locus B family protein [Limibaculum sp. NKW23]GMG85213.1 invasion associated locus B family protein [Limibaculum sp. NKW23]
MTRPMLALALLALAAAAAAAAPAAAAEPVAIAGADSGAWRAFVAESVGGPVCYAASLPTAETGDYERRGTSWLAVGFWPGEGRMGEVSLVAGYPYAEGSTVSLEVDLGSRGIRAFTLLTAGGRAWTADAQADVALVQALRNGARMTVRGTSARGTLTTDTYTLEGSAQAIDAAAKRCAP